LAYSALFFAGRLNSVPKAALVPIFVIWFGAGTVPAVITAFMLSFFQSSPTSRRRFATIGARTAGSDAIARRIATGHDHQDRDFPGRFRFFFASLKIAITLAFVGSVIAEIVAGNTGIGNVMLIASSNFNVPWCLRRSSWWR